MCVCVCVCVWGGGAERWLDRVKEEEGVGTSLVVTPSSLDIVSPVVFH